MKKNPMQPIVFAKDGCIRFKQNKLVGKLLDTCTENGYSLNNLFVDFDFEKEDNDDYIQLMELIGYSVSGFGGLSGIPKKLVRKCDKRAVKLSRKRHS